MSNTNTTFYIVWNLPGGHPKKQHATFQEAWDEAKRLAAKHPDQEFHVMKALTRAKATGEVQVTSLEDAPNKFQCQKAEGSEWILYNGKPESIPPLDAYIQVKYRDGESHKAKVKEFMWGHDQVGGDILAYRILKEPEEEGWIEWKGNETCPVNPQARVEVKFRSGLTKQCSAAILDCRRRASHWWDIMAYRVLPEGA